MLAIISDLHLTDGTCLPTVDPSAFSFLAARLNEQAVRASWRADGSYRPVERVDLLLLGDVLDIIASRRWRQRDIRPWDDHAAPAFSETVGQIVSEILTHNEASLRMLRALAADGAVSVPKLGPMGQPSGERQPVPVRIHYMVGDRDWPLHLSGSGFDVLRQTIAHRLGLSSRHDGPLPHEAAESDELLETLRRHKTMARHGDAHDVLACDGDRAGSSVSDALLLELLLPLADQAREMLADQLPAVLDGAWQALLDVPPLSAPIWINGLLARAGVRAAVAGRVKQLWDEAVGRMLELDFIRQPQGQRPGEIAGALAKLLPMAGQDMAGRLAEVDAWLANIGAGSGCFQKAAACEQDFRNRRARQIVFGHTGRPEVAPLDASYADGYVLNQVYINTGSWRRTIRPTLLNPTGVEFVAEDSVGLTTIFAGDECGGRPYEVSRLQLGVNPHGWDMLRLETAEAEIAASAAGHAKIAAPHFRMTGVGADVTR